MFISRTAAENMVKAESPAARQTAGPDRTASGRCYSCSIRKICLFMLLLGMGRAGMFN